MAKKISTDTPKKYIVLRKYVGVRLMNENLILHNGLSQKVLKALFDKGNTSIILE
jgi:hypothetical protein